MSKAIYIRTDKNGTKIYHDYTCDRCGGVGGSQAWNYTGWTCYKCGGSGRKEKPTVIREYTPEYRAKLDAKNKAKHEQQEKKRIQSIIDNVDNKNQEFLDKYFFGLTISPNSYIYIIAGNTYQVKDELYNEGCKYYFGINWYSNNTSREAFKIHLKELVKFDEYGQLKWKDNLELSKIARGLNDKRKQDLYGTSEYVGTVKEKLTIIVKVLASVQFESAKKFSYYDDGISFINKFIDEQGNILVWVTSKSFTEGETITITGTVKEHSEYEGIKQTKLTRCKVK